MHGLFVPEQKERQRNSKALVFRRFSPLKLQYLLQQKRSIHAAKIRPVSRPAKPA
jgi:hypothetical protein